MSAQFDEIIRELGTLDLKNMYGKDFFLTWDKTARSCGCVRGGGRPAGPAGAEHLHPPV